MMMLLTSAIRNLRYVLYIYPRDEILRRITFFLLQYNVILDTFIFLVLHGPPTGGIYKQENGVRGGWVHTIVGAITVSWVNLVIGDCFKAFQHETRLQKGCAFSWGVVMED